MFVRFICLTQYLLYKYGFLCERNDITCYLIPQGGICASNKYFVLADVSLIHSKIMYDYMNYMYIKIYIVYRTIGFNKKVLNSEFWILSFPFLCKGRTKGLHCPASIPAIWSCDALICPDWVSSRKPNTSHSWTRHLPTASCHPPTTQTLPTD